MTSGNTSGYWCCLLRQGGEKTSRDQRSGHVELKPPFLAMLDLRCLSGIRGESRKGYSVGVISIQGVFQGLDLWDLDSGSWGGGSQLTGTLPLFWTRGKVWRNLWFVRIGGRGLLLASTGWRPGVLLKPLQCAGQPPQQGTIWPQLSVVPKLRSSGPA